MGATLRQRDRFAVRIRIGRRVFRVSSAWVWWKWGLAAFAALMAYILSPIPVMIMAEMTGLERFPMFEAIFEVVYAPIIWLHDEFEIVNEFYELYGDAYDRLFRSFQ